MSTTTQPIAAEQLVIITPALEIWSGTVKVDRENDLINIKNQMPPSALVSDGRKQLIRTDPLKPLHNVRKRIMRTLREGGFSGLTGSGYAVTREHADEFLDQVPELEKEFGDAVDSLVANLPTYYDEQETAFPAWAAMLRKSRLSGEEVRRRCRFAIGIFRIASPDPSHASTEANRFYRDMTAQALPKLLDEIAVDAEDLLEKIEGKASILQKQVEPIRRLVQKLRNFGFLDPRVTPVSIGLSDMLTGLPDHRSLNTPETSVCVMLLKQLTDPASILKHGAGVVATLAATPLPIGPTTAPAVQDDLQLDVATPIAPAMPPRFTPSHNEQRPALAMSF